MNISAQKMSLEMGQNKGYIAQIERKHNLPFMEGFIYICDYLKISPKEFFDDDIELPAIYSELCNNIKELDEDQLININNLVKGLLKK